MGVLAINLFLRAQHLPYQQIGLLSGLYALASALGGPALGRYVDKRGQPAVLIVAALGSGSGFGLLAASRAGNLAVAAAAVALAGLLTPPLEPCLRCLWPGVLPTAGAVAAAYSLDAALQEVIFVIGPLAVIGVAAVLGTAGALWVTGLTSVAGTLAFAAAPPVRAWRGEPRTPHWAGPLRSAALRVLLLSLLCVGIAIGALGIAAVAYGEQVHRSGMAGYLLGANAFGALLGGLAYGARRWPGTDRRRVVVLTLGLAVGYWPLVTAAPPPAILVLGVLSGVFLAPVLACGFVIVGDVAPRGTVTEAFAWVVTTFLVGSSLGSASTGAVVQHFGMRVAFLLPGLAGTAAVTCLAFSRHYGRRPRVDTPAAGRPNRPGTP